MQLRDNFNSDTLMVKNPKVGKISPKIHIIGNTGWATFKADGNCTGAGTSTDPYVISDLNIDVGGLGNGILIENSDVYFKIKNSTIWNSGEGSEDASIKLNGVVNGLIENNTLYDNPHGILLDNSDSNLILNNTILGWFTNGILFLTNSHDNIISNNIIKNGSRGVQSWYTNSNITIYNNTIISNIYGLDLKGVNHTIIDNIIKETAFGIWVDDSNHSKIFRNIINGSRNGEFGLTATDSDNVLIINNTLKYGGNAAIYLVRSDYAKVIGNIISHNGRTNREHGVIIAGSSHLVLLNNTISFNIGSGVYLNGEYATTDYNKILNNTIYNNSGNGVLIQFSNFNNISYNILRDDAGGPYLSELDIRGNNNLIYANHFLNSFFYLGRDRGTNNKWNSSSVGNYWSTYTGVDANDDGIGDTPHFLPSGSYDFLPIWWDSPQVLINTPYENNTFESSPTFNISVSRGILNSTWYTIDNGITNITFTELNGTIDKKEWNEKGVGQIVITFFVNDSKGYLDSETIQVIKSYDTPQITINSPTLDEIIGFTAPEFNITVNDLSPINATWYTIDEGITNYTFSGLTGTVNQEAWDNKGTEIVTLRFYANDSLGYVGFKDIVILKDLIAPIITINSPIQDSVFGSTSPEFNISIIEENLVSTWYTLEGVAGTFSFTGLTGTIDQGIWDSVPQGEISITFYVEDGAGNIGIESVIVIKNIPSQPGIPGYNLIALVGLTLILTLILIKRKLKK